MHTAVSPSPSSPSRALALHGQGQNLALCWWLRGWAAAAHRRERQPGAVKDGNAQRGPRLGQNCARSGGRGVAQGGGAHAATTHLALWLVLPCCWLAVPPGTSQHLHVESRRTGPPAGALKCRIQCAPPQRRVACSALRERRTPPHRWLAVPSTQRCATRGGTAA